MAWTNWGFDGTINEAQWSQMAGLLGNGYVAAGNGDCAVTAVPGARSVSVAAGTLYGDGVVSVNSGAETVAMTTPVNGQWYVIALRRTWATNTAALVAIAGATTTTTTPTTAPTSFPTLNTSAGVLTDQPIAWAWCNSANTTVVIFDLRLLPMRTQPVSVADAAKRDAKFPAPVQGNQVWRDDLGAVETYFGLYNASTNPGGRDTAGWYVETRQTGLRPIQPTSVSIASGTGSANALGVISFTNATAVGLNGVFTSAFKNYRIILNIKNNTGNTDNFFLRFRSAGTDNSTNYTYSGIDSSVNSGGTVNGNYNGAWANSLALIGYDTPTSGAGHIDIYAPAETTPTNYISNFVGLNNVTAAQYFRQYLGTHNVASNFDGFNIWPGANAMSGTIQVLAWND